MFKVALKVFYSMPHRQPFLFISKVALSSNVRIAIQVMLLVLPDEAIPKRDQRKTIRIYHLISYDAQYVATG
ncbi:MAG: hypothetical protein ACTS73_01190 [Arsenophonus sp. NEOnobi-MAG3]